MSEETAECIANESEKVFCTKCGTVKTCKTIRGPDYWKWVCKDCENVCDMLVDDFPDYDDED